MNRHVMRFVTVGVLVAGMLVPAAAQDPALGGLSRPMETMLRDRLIQWAMFSLGGDKGPRPDQIVVARMLFDMALELDSQDPEAWRMRAEIARLEDNHADQERAMQQYIRLVPGDDAAQFERVMLRVSRLRTLEERLAVIERVLDAPSAQRLSEPLRSRLSSAAAMAASELGQEAKHLNHLRQAVRLDPANAQAISLTYRHVRERSDDPQHTGALMINMIKAAPLDASARLALAYALAQQGAYSRAADQFAMTSRLAGEPLSAEEFRLWATSLGAAGRDRDLTRLLDDLSRYLSRVEPPQTLPLELEVVRLAALDREESSEEAAELYQRIEASMLAGGNTDNTQAKARAALLAVVFTSNTARAGQLINGLDPEAEEVQLVRGWIAKRNAQPDQARELLEQLAPTRPLAALGLAMMAGTNESGNVRALTELLQQHPNHPAAMVAARQLRREGLDVPLTSAGQRLVNQMDREPNALWNFDESGLRWTELRMEIQPLRIVLGEPLIARITVRNRAPLPLSIGGGEALPSRLALNINAAVSGQPVGPVGLTIADAARRLTLRSNESYSFDVRLDRGPLARQMETYRYTALSFSTMALLDPRSLPSGALVAGPLGQTARSRVNQVWGRSASADNVDRWISQLESNDPGELAHALGMLAGVGSALQGASVDPEAVRRGGAALFERFKTLDPMQQAWTLLYMDAQDGANRPTQPIIDAAKRSDDPVVRIAYMVTQVKDPQSPAIASGLRHGERSIRDFASAWQVKLRADAEAPPPTDPQ